MNKKVNITGELTQITKYFTPRIIGEVNDVYIKLVKVKGEEVPWHIHDNEDELFFVLKGSLVMQQKSCNDFIMNEGDLFIVPKGVEHRISADKECHHLLVENKTSKHTGNVKSLITTSIEEQSY